MRKVLLEFETHMDLIECSPRMAEAFNYLMEDIDMWVENDPDGAKYKVLNKETGYIDYCITTEAILKFLNTKCLEKGEPEARLYKANISDEYLETVEIWAWERFDENNL